MNWRPNSKPQEDFLAIPDEVREGLYGGQAGGGKSEVLLYLPLTRQFHQYPKFKGIILRRTLPELKRELIPRAEVDGLSEGVWFRPTRTPHPGSHREHLEHVLAVFPEHLLGGHAEEFLRRTG